MNGAASVSTSPMPGPSLSSEPPPPTTDATELQSVTFEALGTTGYVATEGNIDRALVEILAVVDEIDRSCSRFRADSDLAAVNDGAGSYVGVSGLFLEALQTALQAARDTGGVVDPTIGETIRVLGYDRTFADIARRGPAVVHAKRVSGWQLVDVNAARKLVRIPAGVSLDLGATAKGLAADKAAARATAVVGSGVLVSLGGDIAVAGAPPADGWLVGIADSHRAAFEDADEAICLWAGGLATSSTTARRWVRGGETIHHIIDPSTNASAVEVWRTVSVAAPSCVEANVCSTAAVILGDRAIDWLVEQGHPSRLVSSDGAVVRLNGWPEPDADTDGHR